MFPLENTWTHKDTSRRLLDQNLCFQCLFMFPVAKPIKRDTQQLQRDTRRPQRLLQKDTKWHQRNATTTQMTKKRQKTTTKPTIKQHKRPHRGVQGEPKYKYAKTTNVQNVCNWKNHMTTQKMVWKRHNTTSNNVAVPPIPTPFLRLSLSDVGGVGSLHRLCPVACRLIICPCLSYTCLSRQMLYVWVILSVIFAHVMVPRPDSFRTTGFWEIRVRWMIVRTRWGPSVHLPSQMSLLVCLDLETGLWQMHKPLKGCCSSAMPSGACQDLGHWQMCEEPTESKDNLF